MVISMRFIGMLFCANLRSLIREICGKKIHFSQNPQMENTQTVADFPRWVSRNMYVLDLDILTK